MIDFLEKFEIPTLSLIGIEKTTGFVKNNEIYNVWSGGCLVCRDIPTIKGAREYVFSYVKSRLLECKAKSERELEITNKTLKKLDNDYFNLGTFKKE